MARETNGFVYLIGSPDGYCKIGKAVHLDRRVAQVRLQLPYRVVLIHAIKTNDINWLESAFHEAFAPERMNGEWFKLTPESIGSFTKWDFLESTASIVRRHEAQWGLD